MTDITIPAAAQGAGAREIMQKFLFLYLNTHRDPYEWGELPEEAQGDLMEAARAAFLAMIEAWEGAKTIRDDGRRQTYAIPALVLPLPPQENTND